VLCQQALPTDRVNNHNPHSSLPATAYLASVVLGRSEESVPPPPPPPKYSQSRDVLLPAEVCCAGVLLKEWEAVTVARAVDDCICMGQ